MWLVTLSSESDFEFLARELSTDRGFAYELVTTGSGARLARSTEGSGAPHLGLASDDPAALRSLLVWAHRELHPEAFVSSGTVFACGRSWDPQRPLVPRVCYRSAGRLDFGGGSPVLYEEIPFDDVVQRRLCEKLFSSEPAENTGLFCSTKPVTSNETRDLLGSKLDCQAVDAHTAEILIAGRHLAVPVGCLKALAGPGAQEVLLRSWTALLAR
jgi:hypothetical protein